MNMYRKLKAQEIDCRVKQVKENGLMLLLYKDARVDQKLLDETHGEFGWQKKYEVIGGNLYCTVSIKDPDTGEWISKQDVGTESETEKEKGQASDAFKRACFNWGIGRELYTAPFIWITPNGYTNIQGKVYDRFKVDEIEYDESGDICHLIITNTKLNKVVYKWDSGDAVKVPGYPPRDEMIKVVVNRWPYGSKGMDNILETFKVTELEDATDAQIISIFNKVEK